FFNLNSNQNYYRPDPIYYMSYRYLFKKSAIRFGIGGGYAKNDLVGYKVNGEDKIFHATYTNFSVRIGYEFTSELSKRWQAFYGLDFRPTIYSQVNEANNSNGGYINGSVNKETTYGFSPLLGFRFRLNDRVSLTTEASFSYNIRKAASQSTYVSQDNALYPNIPNGKVTQTTNIAASFATPLFLILTVKL
ncbi:MAG: hypothetical protein V4580_19770, partial [Bacteroidota bacterium]